MMDMTDHKDQPFIYTGEIGFQDLGGGVKRKILAYGDQLMCCEIHFEKGSVGALHHHPHTQASYVLEGAFEFTIGGEKKVVRKGDMLFKLPNVEHGAVCLEKGVLLDIFTPVREDFLK